MWGVFRWLQSNCGIHGNGPIHLKQTKQLQCECAICSWSISTRNKTYTVVNYCLPCHWGLKSRDDPNHDIDVGKSWSPCGYSALIFFYRPVLGSSCSCLGYSCSPGLVNWWFTSSSASHADIPTYILSFMVVVSSSTSSSQVCHLVIGPSVHSLTLQNSLQLQVDKNAEQLRNVQHHSPAPKSLNLWKIPLLEQEL